MAANHVPPPPPPRELVRTSVTYWNPNAESASVVPCPEASKIIRMIQNPNPPHTQVAQRTMSVGIRGGEGMRVRGGALKRTQTRQGGAGADSAGRLARARGARARGARSRARGVGANAWARVVSAGGACPPGRVQRDAGTRGYARSPIGGREIDETLSSMERWNRAGRGRQAAVVRAAFFSRERMTHGSRPFPSFEA